MSASRYSAPGKAVLCGEYAVLRGAPAVSMALDRRAKVTVAESGDGPSRVRAPGHAASSWRFEPADGGLIRWLDRPPAVGLDLVEFAFEVCAGSSIRSLALTIDTRDFRDSRSGQKLGLGASGAAATALVAALLGPRSTASECWPLARRVHGMLQEGKGSGIDVATSCEGGLVAYRADNDVLPVRLRWPAGLCYRYFYSGRAADTVAAIKRLDASTGSAAAWLPLLEAAEVSAAAWTTGNAARVVDALRDYGAALRGFSDSMNLGIYDAGHDALAGIAKDAGLLYKPCGAGGGDIGVAFALDTAELEAFSGSAEQIGFVPLDIHMDDKGVGMDPEERV